MEFPKFKTVFNKPGIELLPHRDPFLFVDTLLSADETGALGEYTFTAEKNEFFKGHFPDYPVVPGVVLIETMCQVGGAAAVARGVLGDKPAFAFASVENARFRRPVRPGEKLVTVVKIIRERVPLGTYDVKGYVGDELAAEATVKCMLMNGRR
jgi:3-hydroxyacyl-[acyl-carrier-protein] dehydratase